MLNGFNNIPWDDFVRAKGFLSDQEVSLLKKTEENSLEYILGDQVGCATVAAVRPAQPPRPRRYRHRLHSVGRA